MWPLAFSVAELFGHQTYRGITSILFVVVARLFLTTFVDLALDGVARRSREDTRQHLGVVLRRLGRSERRFSALVPAIEMAARRGSIEALKWAAATSALGLLVLWHYGSWQPTLIVLVMVALSIPWYVRAGRVAAADDSTYRRLREDLTTNQRKLLRHASELRSLGALPYGAQRIEALSSREHRATASAIRRALGSSLVTDFLGGVCVGLVAMVIGFGLLRGRASLEAAALCVLATAEIVTWIRRYGAAFHQREAIDQSLDLLSASSPSTAPSDVLIECRDLVTLRNVQAVTLSIRSGDRVAVVGPSGVGKSTLLATWLGWEEPSSGYSSRSAEPIGHVSPLSALVAGTVRDNLLAGSQHPDEVLKDILNELRLTCALDDHISVDGYGLSTGERLRLILARALVNHVALLVLDDVAGLLDSENRSWVREALSRRPTLAVVEASVDAAQLIEAECLVVLA